KERRSVTSMGMNNITADGRLRHSGTICGFLKSCYLPKSISHPLQSSWRRKHLRASCGPVNGVFAARKNFKQPVAGIVILREAWLSSTRQKGTQIMAAQIHQFICLKDNFAVLIHDPATRATAAIDAPEAAPILAALEARRWALTDVLVTHHHFDHVQGLAGLKAKFPRARIIGPAKEAEKIGGLDLAAGEGDRIAIGALEARVIEVPGHTSGHIAYWFASEEVLFAGDALFALGCGRGFEEPPEVLYHSLLKLAA